MYIDSGAMYRATTLYALRNGLINNGELKDTGIRQILDNVTIDFKKTDHTRGYSTYLNEELVENKIRGMEVSEFVSDVSRVPAIREKMVAIQQQFAEKKSVVMDGRDIGTVVFPGADIKIFLTASPEVRANRRFKELEERGVQTTFADVLANIKKRDFIDENREISPLKKADDAVVLDNSEMSVDEQMRWFGKKFETLFR